MFIKRGISFFNKVVIDIRSPRELLNGKIPGALNIEMERFIDLVSKGELDKKESYIIYCQKGARSRRVAFIGQNRGYTISDIEGGYNQWLKELKNK